MEKRKFLKILLRAVEKVHCYVTVFILTPSFLIFEMVVVRPALIEAYEPGIAKQLLHISLCMLCFINVAGNMMMSIFCDCSFQGKLSSADGEYCELCKTHRPPKAWHCKTCNVCILKRDHHCYFFSRCIGLYNRRYYLMYLVHVHIAMVYSTYYNYYFVSSKYKDHGYFLVALRILNPLLRYVIYEPMSFKDLYVLLFLMNVGLVFWSAFLVWFHMTNTLKGLTAHEYRDPAKFNWKDNLISVFGTRWYLAIVWPFADSPTIDTADTIRKTQ